MQLKKKAGMLLPCCFNFMTSLQKTFLKGCDMELKKKKIPDSTELGFQAQGYKTVSMFNSA